MTERIPVEMIGALPIQYYFRFVKVHLLDDATLAKSLNDKQIEALKANAKPSKEYVKEVYLDVETLKNQEGLNDKQIEILTGELIARGLLPAPAVEAATKPTDEKPKKEAKSKPTD